MALRLSDEMWDQIEAERGEVKREPWIRQAIEMRLRNKRAVAQRSSADAKRTVRPLPKDHTGRKRA